MFFRDLLLASEIEFLFFLSSEQRKRNVNTSSSPACHFILKPVAPSRAGCHRQSPLPRTFDPMEFRRHASAVSFHYDFSRKGVNVDATTAKNINSVVPVEYSAIRSRFQAVSLSQPERLL